MNAPIRDFTDKYASSGILRCHMPGHKGVGEDISYVHDITEISGADSLFEADGIIAESECNAARIFGTHRTIYSAGGSTLCIQTMIALLTAGGHRKIAAARNCHRALLNACALLGVDVNWIYPRYKDSFVSGELTPSMIEEAITADREIDCVYITSPDYLGRLAPVREIAEICHKYGIRLAVDNAHGAYLRFFSEHPTAQGADICCDSAHKTLPVLTGGAYLHIMDSTIEQYDGHAKELMSMFGSSSPSYLIMRSLDVCNTFMADRAKEYFSEMAAASAMLKERLAPFWSVEQTEAGKLTIFAPPSGYTGNDLAEQFRSRGAECEYADRSHVVFMLTGLTPQQIGALGDIAESIPQPRIFINIQSAEPPFPLERAMSLREAALSPCEQIPVEEAVGRICSRAVTCCPPGVAVVTGGEVISDECVKFLKSTGILFINVVK